MNKTIFYTGVLMLFAPFLVFSLISLVSLLVNLEINFGLITLSLCGLAYFIVALYCIVRGINEKSESAKGKK